VNKIAQMVILKKWRLHKILIFVKINSMKLRLKHLLFTILIIGLGTSLNSCSRKSGCPANDINPSKREVKKGGKSNLFGKQTRRKFKAKR